MCARAESLLARLALVLSVLPELPPACLRCNRLVFLGEAPPTRLRGASASHERQLLF